MSLDYVRYCYGCIINPLLIQAGLRCCSAICAFWEPHGNPRTLQIFHQSGGSPMQKRITSARQVETLPPSDMRQELRDGEVKGLILRITPAGDKSWSVLYSRQPDGKKRRITIGPFPAVTLEKAR